MDNFNNILDKINTVLGSIIFVLIISMALLSKFLPVRILPYIILVVFLFFSISIIIRSTIFTIGFLMNLVKNKNVYLLIVYSVLTFVIYIIADIHTSELIYDSLGYNPKYVPHTFRIISLASLLYIGLCLTAFFTFAIGNFITIIFTIFNSLIRPFLFFLNENKLNTANAKLSHLGCGSIFLATLLLFLSQCMNEYINFSKIIRTIAVNTDYYSIQQSGFICEEAKQYEAFNYLSNNMISVYHYDQLNNKDVLSIINCPTV